MQLLSQIDGPASLTEPMKKKPVYTVASGFADDDAKKTKRVRMVVAQQGLGIGRGVDFRGGKPRERKWWRIYHIESGLCLPYCAADTIKEAKTWLKKYVRIKGVDWTMRSKTLQDNHGLVEKIRALAPSDYIL